MLIEMHMLKNFPPTNLNRDENGSPKTCYFGGSQRGRISSQSLKHAWRRYSEFSRLPLGVRTRKLPRLVSEELIRRGVQKEYIAIAKKKLSGFGNREGNENDELITSQIMFFAQEDIAAVAEQILSTIRETGSPKEFEKIKLKQWQDILKKQVRPITLDMALFGRMITDDSFRDVEASLQVAHAISTHVVNQESDFFTAVDDLQKKECGYITVEDALQKDYRQESGSAMMDDTDYNSCCYYFFASLDTDQLLENIKDSPEVKSVLPDVLPTLLESMSYTNPSGKQNSFAGHAYPGLICVERKQRKVPISYVNAFETPVRSAGGYMNPSIRALAQTIDQFDNRFALPVEERLWFNPSGGDKPQNAEPVDTLPSLLARTTAWLSEE